MLSSSSEAILPVVKEPPVLDVSSKMSRRRLPDYVKKLHQQACRTCSTIIFLHSTNQIIDLWRCLWHCRLQIWSTLLTKWRGLCVTHDIHGILRSPRKVKHFIYEDSGGIFSSFILKYNCNGSSRMNGYVIIMRVFRNCPHCSVSRVIRKLFFFFIFSQKVAALSNYFSNYF